MAGILDYATVFRRQIYLIMISSAMDKPIHLMDNLTYQMSSVFIYGIILHQLHLNVHCLEVVGVII